METQNSDSSIGGCVNAGFVDSFTLGKALCDGFGLKNVTKLVLTCDISGDGLVQLDVSSLIPATKDTTTFDNVEWKTKERGVVELLKRYRLVEITDEVPKS